MINSKTVLSSLAALAIGYILIGTLPSGIINHTTSGRGGETTTLEGDESLQSKDKIPEAEAPASNDSIVQEEQGESSLKSARNGELSVYYFLILDFLIAIGVYLAAKRLFF